MRDALAPNTLLGYCTNVHAGADWPATREALLRYAVDVKSRVSPDAPMGVGLWLSAQTARSLIAEDRIGELHELLDAHQLLAFTINGFPYGDFHQAVVKHRVYEPDWTHLRRIEYTKDVATILAALLARDPSHDEGSISTLPIGWPATRLTADADARPGGASARGDLETDRLAMAARGLLDVAAHLRRLEERTGTLIHLDLEPEPGCLLQDAEGVGTFFDEYLINGPHADIARRHLRVCHDVCHAAVMHEDQHDAFATYARHGVEVGKVQISNAIRAVVQAGDSGEPSAALAAFSEDRYLHQTTVRHAGDVSFYEDLTDALAAEMSRGDAEWRVHYHVPVYLERFGDLETTRSCIAGAIDAALSSGVRHFEIETYAWNVLPAPLRVDDLAAGIAREIEWVLNEHRVEGAAS